MGSAGRTAVQLPAVLGTSGQVGVKHSGTMNPEPRLPALPREHLSPFGAILQPPLGSPLVTTEHGEPLPLEIPRMS